MTNDFEFLRVNCKGYVNILKQIYNQYFAYFWATVTPACFSLSSLIKSSFESSYSMANLLSAEKGRTVSGVHGLRGHFYFHNLMCCVCAPFVFGDAPNTRREK